MNNKSSDILNVNNYILDHKEDFIKDIGEIIKSERTNKKITLEEMALRTKTSTSYITQIEKGTYGLSLIKFITICNALEVNEKIFEKFLYAGKESEDKLYYELQNGKNLSRNIINYLKYKEKNNIEI